MAKTVQQMSLAELEAEGAGAPAPFSEVISELVYRIRTRVRQVESARQTRIDCSIAAQLQGGSTASPDDLLTRAETIEAARDVYVTARLTGPGPGE